MTVLINDNLQSYSPGTGYPDNFVGAGITFTYDFINFTTGQHPRPSPGFYERVGIGYQYFGNQLQYPVPANLSVNSVDSTSVFWAAFGFIGVNLVSVNPDNTNDATTLLSFTLETDYSLSINVPGAAKKNSLTQVYYADTWQYWQVNADFSNVGGFVVVTVSVAVDGIIVFNNIALTSTVNVSSLWNNLAEINAWQWTGSAYFGEFTILAGAASLPYFPNEAMTINMRSAQMVIEYARQQIPNLRISQAVVEVMKVPNRSMRAAQMVVEIVVKGTFNPAGGFYVRET